MPATRLRSVNPKNDIDVNAEIEVGADDDAMPSTACMQNYSSHAHLHV